MSAVSALAPRPRPIIPAAMTNRSHSLSLLALVSGLLVGTSALRLTPSRSISVRGSISPHARNGPPLMLELPKLPNPFGDGGPSFPELPNPFAEEFVPKPGDVSFIDTDGEQVTLRKVGGKVCCPDPSQPTP